jgi:hypothetical protein
MFTYSWNVPFAIMNFTARLLQRDSKHTKLQTENSVTLTIQTVTRYVTCG